MPPKRTPAPRPVEDDPEPRDKLDDLLDEANALAEDPELEVPKPVPVVKAKEPAVAMPAAPAAPPKKPAVYVHPHDSSIAYS